MSAYWATPWRETVRSSPVRMRLRPPGPRSTLSLRHTIRFAPTSAAVGDRKRLTQFSLRAALGIIPDPGRLRQADRNVSKENHHRIEPKLTHNWRRIHHSPLFWVGGFLSLAAITIYVLSEDLSWRPSDAATVGEAEYSSKIVGDWQGQVPGANETISFGSDGRFTSSVRPGGFISMTLGQAVTSTVRGTWAINGRSLALNIGSAEPERVSNSAAAATIESFKPNELVVKSSVGDVSTFIRQ